jgi:hypothetical protein
MAAIIVVSVAKTACRFGMSTAQGFDVAPTTLEPCSQAGRLARAAAAGCFKTPGK